jgi:hypothetical protein
VTSVMRHGYKCCGNTGRLLRGQLTVQPWPARASLAHNAMLTSADFIIHLCSLIRRSGKKSSTSCRKKLGGWEIIHSGPAQHRVARYDAYGSDS